MENDPELIKTDPDMGKAPEIKKIELDAEDLKNLNTTRKWTMFLSILGFIGIGLIVIIGLGAGIFMTAFKTSHSFLGRSEWLVSFFILVFAVIYFFPVLFLFRFSKYTSNAVQSLDRDEMKKALKNLKSYYVYIGILLIIVLALYVIMIAGMGASMAFIKNL
ncbi:MAG: hypothetical protein ABSG89_07635 [Bacteroidales bacterium]|jgi:magnesium-transporting ATPase (P-type)